MRASYSYYGVLELIGTRRAADGLYKYWYGTLRAYGFFGVPLEVGFVGLQPGSLGAWEPGLARLLDWVGVW